MSSEEGNSFKRCLRRYGRKIKSITINKSKTLRGLIVANKWSRQFPRSNDTNVF